MASSEEPAGERESAGDPISEIAEAYRQMPMATDRYVMVVLVPAAVFALLCVVAAVLLPVGLLIKLLIVALAVLALGAGLLFPRIKQDQDRVEMENQLPLMITHMTILSTTNIDRMEVFRKIADEETYGALAREIHHVVQLVDTWYQSLDDACRRRADVVPSEPVGDLFDRLAYSLSAGQSLSDFLLTEQTAVMDSYETIYESNLANLDVMSDLYLSMILSSTFGLVFAVVLPILTGTDPTMTVSAVLVLFLLVQGGFTFGIYTVAPTDPLWYHAPDVRTATKRRIQLSFLGAGVAMLPLLYLSASGWLGLGGPGLGDALFFLDSVPMELYVLVPLTPLVVPGLIVRFAESRIRARDEAFPSFIRALGATESAKQSTTSKVLKQLRRKDFGALTGNVENLYRRLNMRIEPAEAWNYFAAETHSYLIQKFSEMYLVGRQMGGDPQQLGELISENMNVVIQLRERRKQATITLIGMLYGITAAATFAFFIALKIVIILSQMSLGVDMQSMQVGQLIYTNAYNIPLIKFLLLVIVVFNGLLSSLIIRIVDGGHKGGAALHFVLLCWLGGLIAIFTRWFVGLILTV